MRKHYVVPLEKKDRSKCRKWQLRVDSGRKTPSGAISWKTKKVVDKTWTQANELCDQWAVDLDEGRAVVVGRKWTFREYRDHWIECLRAAGLKAESTVKLRASCLKVAGMHLDRFVIGEIGTADIDAMTAAIRRGETPSGISVSGTYARKVVESVTQMLEAAVKDGLVARNVARDAFQPKPDTPEKRLVTMAELARLEDAMDPADWRQRVVIILAETGMRQCEVMPPDPMLWGAWDEGAGLIRVSDSKNVNGLRLVPVTRTLSEALTVARFHLQLELGEDDISVYPIACDDMGMTHTENTLQRWWADVRGEYGLEGVGLHQLRHAMVSHLLSNGASLKEVQDIIGDKTGGIVLGVYAHSTLDERAAALDSLDAARRVQNLYKNEHRQTS